MAYRRRRMNRKRGLRKRRGYRSRRPAARRVNDVASMSESIIFTGIGPVGPSTGVFQTGVLGTTFNVYRNTDLSLSTFSRAPIVAAAYQQFKIQYLELTIKPDFDTFIAGGPSARPCFYYMIDKGNSINFNVTNQAIKSMGAKPILLDDKTIKIRWRPGVVLANEIQTSTGTTAAQQYMLSPYLPCDANTSIGTFDPSQVCHQGIKFFAENNGATLNYTATLTAHFRFKKPSLPVTSTTTPPA